MASRVTNIPEEDLSPNMKQILEAFVMAELKEKEAGEKQAGEKQWTSKAILIFPY